MSVAMAVQFRGGTLGQSLLGKVQQLAFKLLGLAGNAQPLLLVAQADIGLAIAYIKGSQFNEARDTLKPLLEKSPNDITYNLALPPWTWTASPSIPGMLLAPRRRVILLRIQLWACLPAMTS